MGEMAGMAAAMLSSALGGAAVGATRYLAGVLDPLAVGVFRFGIGVLLLAPLALLGKAAWPSRRDWPATAGLGLLFFALFPLLFNASLRYTTAARGALALSALPLLTMAVAAALGVERLNARKTTGVLIAMAGVAAALLTGLSTAPPGAWRGDLLMLAAALCMACYSVWSRPVIRRAGPVTFTVAAMAVGVLGLLPLALARGSFAPVAQFGTAQWLAIGYLGVFGGAIGFFLWAWALGRTGPTLVAVSVTVNPVTAALVGAWVLDEPLRWNLVLGLVAVLAGIALASTARERP
ncbi:DMT family transporter [Pseudorhodoferax sp. Leaf267]|uniref:DMT family transporter n=1 Tax=Pseudorhodoferax sp. Leaf267 TaxID=1736316 RepID=UPI0006FA4751|nr:DMT family transporter [Pseudorhodoferax sp. Leaf267]KQP21583.1 permease [Pseudorhodoferax sp. Leaf267]